MEILANNVTILRRPPDSWNDLRGSLAGPKHELDWFQACIEAFRLEPFIVAVGLPARPKGACPLGARAWAP